MWDFKFSVSHLLLVALHLLVPEEASERGGEVREVAVEAQIEESLVLCVRVLPIVVGEVGVLVAERERMHEEAASMNLKRAKLH